MRYQKNSTPLKGELTASVKTLLYLTLTGISILAALFAIHRQWIMRGVQVEAIENKCSRYERQFKGVDSTLVIIEDNIDTLQVGQRLIIKTLESMQ